MAARRRATANSLLPELQSDPVINVIAGQVFKRRFRSYMKTEISRTLGGDTHPLSHDIGDTDVIATSHVFSRAPGEYRKDLGKKGRGRKSLTVKGKVNRRVSLPSEVEKGREERVKKWVSPFDVRDVAVLRRVKDNPTARQLSVVASPAPISPVPLSPSHSRSASKTSPGNERYLLSPFQPNDSVPLSCLSRTLRLQAIRAYQHSPSNLC